MAYRRRQGIARASTFKEETHYSPDGSDSSSHSSSSSLAAQAIRASAAHRDSSSLSSAYSDSAFHSSFKERSKFRTTIWNGLATSFTNFFSNYYEVAVVFSFQLIRCDA
ncbi:hypothetical protein U1Q18_013983 [Sarracenia purpurea var. burkii]